MKARKVIRSLDHNAPDQPGLDKAFDILFFIVLALAVLVGFIQGSLYFLQRSGMQHQLDGTPNSVDRPLSL